jgi:PAS domain S-box-containing protein
MDINALSALKPLRLLYVEDDAATREELASMLGYWTDQLDVATNGQAGLALYLEKRHDIVVTDIQMPIMSGLVMSAEIRRIAPRQPIIVLSAYNDVEFLFRAIELGINQYITKPVNVEMLLEKLAEIAEVLQAKQEQQRNRRLLEQYRHLVDASAIVSKFDPQGRITYVNDRFCELSGYDQQALLGSEIRRMRHPDEPKDISGKIWQSVLDGNKWAGIVKNQTRSGAMYVVDSSLVPIVNERNKVEEIVCLDVDITDVYLNYENMLELLSRSERSLNEQRHLLDEYKRVLELGASILVVDPGGRILGANLRLAGMLGYEIKDLCEQSLSELVPDDYSTCLRQATQSIDGHCSQVIPFIHQNGTERTFSVTFMSVRDPRGQINSIILSCQDVTEPLRLTHDIVETQRELLLVLGEVVENRSQETGKHVYRVAEIAHLLALRYGLNKEQAEILKTAAPMHDIGKVGIDDSILHKPGKLDADEFEIMKTHAELGHHILTRIDRPLLSIAARIAHEHHENYDGSGYPRGLKGVEISIEGRIIAIADVLDALGQPRVYKAAWDDAAIRDYFITQRGRKFDPTLVDLVLKHWDAIANIRQNFRDI